MIRTAVKILIVGILATAGLAQEPLMEENGDEATIILPDDLSFSAQEKLFQAISGVPSQVTTGDGDSYLLVPGNATVIIITPEDLQSSSNEVLPPEQLQSSSNELFPPSLESFSPALNVKDFSPPHNSLPPLSLPATQFATQSHNISASYSINKKRISMSQNKYPAPVAEELVPDEESITTECTDIPPSTDYTCIQQAEFGKCNAQFIVEGNYCASSCGRCIISAEKSSGPMEVSQQECIPLSVLLLTRNDTQSFRDAIKTVELDDLLSDADYTGTIFIPNDQAFYKALQILGQTSPLLTRLSMLKNLMQGHIIPNTAIQTQNFVDDQLLFTLAEDTIWNVQFVERNIQIVGGNLGPANIVEQNVVSCNVVAHVIDTVLVAGVF